MNVSSFRFLVCVLKTRKGEKYFIDGIRGLNDGFVDHLSPVLADSLLHWLSF